VRPSQSKRNLFIVNHTKTYLGILNRCSEGRALYLKKRTVKRGGGAVERFLVNRPDKRTGKRGGEREKGGKKVRRGEGYSVYLYHPLSLGLRGNTNNGCAVASRLIGVKYFGEEQSLFFGVHVAATKWSFFGCSA